MEVILANPRGFCAGVERAITIVERALVKFGAPIYVRHEVVHNKFVCDGLRAKGAIFIDELADVPATAMAFVGLALAFVLWTYYWILVSRTRVDAGLVQQTWFGTKTVRIADITKIKFISIPYLEWLIAPRIVVQVRSRGSYTFYAADREVMQVFAKLSMGML